jgi:hypothetical protein
MTERTTPTPWYGLLAAGLLATSCGCLQLGGTTHMHESTETPKRITALERRVGSLEQQYATLTGQETYVATQPNP